MKPLAFILILACDALAEPKPELVSAINWFSSLSASAEPAQSNKSAHDFINFMARTKRSVLIIDSSPRGESSFVAFDMDAKSFVAEAPPYEASKHVLVELSPLGANEWHIIFSVPGRFYNFWFSYSDDKITVLKQRQVIDVF